MYSANKFPELTDYAPKNWEVKKVKYVFTERKEMNNPVKTTDLISLTYDRGVIPHAEKGNIGNKQKDDFAKYQLVYPDDLVINSMNVIIGSAGLSKYFGLVSPVYYILTPRKESGVPSFFHYLFRSVVFQKSLVGLGNGILEHRMRITMDTLGDQHIPLPPTATQKLIVQYLDKRTGQVNALIAKVETKIELLKEQRTSLINECVTKGLDSTVAMKDSGVEWIGKIPCHWQTKKFDYSFEVQKGKLPSTLADTASESRLPYLTMDVLRGGEPTSFANKSESIVADKNSIGLLWDGANAGEIVKIGTTGVLSSTMALVSSDDPKLNKTYSYYLLKSLENDFRNNTVGMGVPHVDNNYIKSCKVVVPPLAEQKQITAYLDKRRQQIDALIAAETRRIALLTEYKESLVSSVVTGKIRVTEKML